MFLRYLTFFPRFFLFKTLKNVVKCKACICKNPTKNNLRGCLAMIFIDFGMLRSPYCKISHLLADIKIRVKTSRPTYEYDSVCKDNSWIRGKCRQRFYQTFTNVFFLHLFHVFTFLTFFICLCERLLHLWVVVVVVTGGWAEAMGWSWIQLITTSLLVFTSIYMSTTSSHAPLSQPSSSTLDQHRTDSGYDQLTPFNEDLVQVKWKSKIRCSLIQQLSNPNCAIKTRYKKSELMLVRRATASV